MLGRDAQRVEDPPQRGIGTQRDRLGVRGDIVEQVKAMVALGVAVDDACALQEGLVLELLGERGLARAERAHAQDRRVAVAVGALAEVEAHGLARARECVTQIEAPLGARGVSGGGHHRRHLLGGEGVVVARDPRALRRQMLKEQRDLIAERAMEAHLSIGAPARLHTLGERLLIGGADGDGERGAQERRTARGLQVGEQIARLLGA